MVLQRTITTVDDLDQKTEAIDTLMIGNNGDWYEIDLGEDNRRRYWDFMTPFFKAARKITRSEIPSGMHRKRRAATVTVDHRQVRRYCQHKGIPVNDQGTPSLEAKKAYVKAWHDETLPAEFY